MNAEQKQRIAHEISRWNNARKASDPALWFLTCDCMAALLQELVDAPEPEPVAYLIDWPDEPELGHCLSEEPNDSGHSRPLYTAPPAPSVPDGWKLVPYSPTVLMLERAEYAVNNRPQPSKYEPSATPAIIFWTAMLNYAPEAPQDAEPPTDLPTWENGDDPLVSGGLIHRGVVDFVAQGVWSDKSALSVSDDVVHELTPPEPPADVARDAGRLNWLQQQMQRATIRTGATMKLVNAWSIAADGTDLREAIDAARGRQGGK